MDLDKCQLAQNKQILHDANKQLVLFSFFFFFWSENKHLVSDKYLCAVDNSLFLERSIVLAPTQFK